MRFVFAAVIGISRCSNPFEEPDLADYDATCATAQDCVFVTKDLTCGFSCGPLEHACLSLRGADDFERDFGPYAYRYCDGLGGMVGCSTVPEPACECLASTCGPGPYTRDE